MFSVDSSVDSTQQKKETMNLKIVQKKLYKLKGKGQIRIKQQKQNIQELQDNIKKCIRNETGITEGTKNKMRQKQLKK